MHEAPRSVRRLIDRRAALTKLGLATAAVALGSTTWPQQAAAQSAVIRTVLHDLDPATLTGPVLFHEHLSMRYPLGIESHFTDDVALMVEEARAARSDGIACIVDGGHADMMRSTAALRRISSESGLAIVASGGFYMQRSYPADLAAKSEDQLADELVELARQERHGAFGEIGQQGGVLTADEQKVFGAVGKAQAKTGLPLFTHNPYLGMRPGAADIPREAALRQLDVLEKAGAASTSVAIGHVCCLDDPKAAVASAIARRGAFVGFDRVTIQLVPDAQKVTTILAMVEAGHADKVLISSDFSSARALKRNGGAGLGQAATLFGPMLVQAGLGEAVLRQVLVDNPRRFLAFTPKG